MSIIISGSGVRTGDSTVKVLEFGTEGTLTLNGDLSTTGSAGFAAITATGLASLDGGINVNDSLTVSNAGAVAGATSIDASGDLTVGTITNAEFTVDASGNTDIDGTLNVEGVPTFQAAAVFSSGITTAGAIGGGTTLALTGLASVASISMDDGSTLGPDSVADLWTFNADGDTIQKDGAYDFNLASHDGTNGLKLGGVLVNASAADLNFTNVAAAGTAEASKAVVVDSNKDISGLRAVSATSYTDGTATLTGGRFAALADLTASYAKIGVLDVVTINSKTTTIENVEISASLMILSDGATAANEADGSGLWLSGANAFFGWNNSKAALSASHKMFVNGNMELGSGASLVIGSADLNEADLEKLDGITNGTAAASKAMVLDASADITGARNLTISGELDAATGDFSGDIDVDGTANLDAVDIDGAVQLDGTFTSGVDGTGYDFKLFGDTAGAYMLWDESADDLKLVGAAGMTIASDLDVDGTTNLDAVDIDGAVQLDGTLTVGVDGTGYDVKLFGDTASAYMLWDTSADDLVFAGAAGINIPASRLQIASTVVAATAAQIDFNVVTAGTAAASKSVVLDGSKNIATIGTIGCGAITSTGASTMGSLNVGGTLACDTSLTLDAVAINATELGYIDGVTAGTALASKALVLDSDKAVTGITSLTGSTLTATAMFSGSTMALMGASLGSGQAIIVPETFGVKAGQFITYSDASLKKNIKPLGNAIEKVMSMRGVSYEMKNADNSRKEIGFIAQEMKNTVPEVVYGASDGEYGIDYAKLTSVLVEAVKAQQSQIDELKALLKK